MRSLKESLLADIEDTLDKGESDIKLLQTFGNYFEFDYIVCLNNSTANNLKLSSLKNENNNLYINQKIKNYIDFYINKISSNKLKLFAYIIDNINLIDIDIDINDLTKNKINDDNFRVELGEKIHNYCINKKLFNKNNYVKIFIPSKRVTGPDHIKIMYVKGDASNQMFEIKYKIKI